MAINSVAAERGWNWIAAGWLLFMRAPGPWIGMMIALTAIFLVMSVIPVIGAIAVVVLTPVFVAGPVIGCRALDEGRPLEFTHLFAGFRERFGTLAAVGAISLVAILAIAFIAGLITGFNLFALFSGPLDPAAIAAALVSVVLTLLIMLALMLPVYMALWFAPALVVLQGKGALAAMGESFAGCMKNVLPFLLNGVILFFLAIAASIPFGLGWLALGPVVVASVYTAYRDIFVS
jgi:hypothetical protein